MSNWKPTMFEYNWKLEELCFVFVCDTDLTANALCVLQTKLALFIQEKGSYIEFQLINSHAFHLIKFLEISSVDQSSSFSVDQKFKRVTWAKLFANLFRRSKLVLFKRSKLVFFKRSKLFATLVSWSNVLFFSISEVQKTLD